ncbi:heme-binding domain-containing protein [Flavobacteriaceae bacterium D16]|nr:heme-binding domain-containing protein [Flavobacteriaceae bacterium D16]
MKIVKKIAFALLVVFIGMQFYQPEKNIDNNNHLEVFLTETNPPEQVRMVLKQACYDCHSNNTVYPWYNNIAPVSYWLADHVDHGKGDLNFSDWAAYSVKKKDHKLEEVVEVIEGNEMPLEEYSWTHAEARLTEAQRKALIEWAENTRLLYKLNQRPE